MIHLEKKDHFPDFHYYRSSSPVYKEYLKRCGLVPYDFEESPQFWWKKDIFIGHVVTHDRSDVEPNLDALKTLHWLKHGIVIWIPNRIIDIPKGWRELWISGHFKETWFNVLENEEYDKKWNERARRAKKKFLTSWHTVKSVTPKEFSEAFKKTKIKSMYKTQWIEYYKNMVEIDPKSIRQRLSYDENWIPTAWLAVHDYLNSSVHLVAFTGNKAYKSQGGTALIDIWFKESLEKNIKYISFDQLRQKFWPKDQKGYTNFKMNFIEYRMSFPKAYFKMF